MVSEGIQTNGFNRTTTSDQQTSPPNQNIPIRPLPPQPQLQVIVNEIDAFLSFLTKVSLLGVDYFGVIACLLSGAN